MAISYEQIPFNLTFTQAKYFSNNKVEYYPPESLNQFYECESDIINEAIKLNELTEVWVLLSAKIGFDIPSDAKLFIEGIDSLIDVSFNDDTQECFIQADKETPLFIQRSNSRSYPWIPGRYRINVTWNGKKYYSLIKICSLHLEEDQFSIMIQEIEQMAIGLARQSIRTRSGLDFSNIKVVF